MGTPNKAGCPGCGIEWEHLDHHCRKCYRCPRCCGRWWVSGSCEARRQEDQFERAGGQAYWACTLAQLQRRMSPQTPPVVLVWNGQAKHAAAVVTEVQQLESGQILVTAETSSGTVFSWRGGPDTMVGRVYYGGSGWLSGTHTTEGGSIGELVSWSPHVPGLLEDLRQEVTPC